METLVGWLELNGFSRASLVRDVGDYAQRGGILDLYAPALPSPLRLDFFGDTLESIRAFDAETQRSTGPLRSLDLTPMSEAQLTTDTIRRFRQGYAAAFGAARPGDSLYEAVSEGRRALGLEHWLPLFYEKLDTLFDYVGDAPVVLDVCAEDVARNRFAQIEDYYGARKHAREQDPVANDYQPLKPDRLYLTPEQFAETLAAAALWRDCSRSRPRRRRAT